MADPLDALRQPEVPIAPSPGFARDLRQRLSDALGLTADRRVRVGALLPYLPRGP